MAYTGSGAHVTSSLINGIFPALLSSAFAKEAYVPTSETTTSVNSFVNLTTVGPTVTVTSTGTLALVYISSFITASAAHNAEASVAVTGASTITAQTNANDGLHILNANNLQVISTSLDLVTINPGTNTYTMQYSNSGAQTGTFALRKIIVIAP